MSETVRAAETALYCFLFRGSIFFFAMFAPLDARHCSQRNRELAPVNSNYLRLGKKTNTAIYAGDFAANRDLAPHSGRLVASSQLLWFRRDGRPDRDPDFSNSVISSAVLGLLSLFNARSICSSRRRPGFGPLPICSSWM